jgi:hypothetical protein
MSPKLIHAEYLRLRRAVEVAQDELEAFAASTMMACEGHASTWCKHKPGDVAQVNGRLMRIDRIGLSPGLLGNVRWVYHGRIIKKDGNVGLTRMSETEPVIKEEK